MPPPSAPSVEQVNHDGQSPLSNEDVELLYLIITNAQERPEAAQFPFRALFSAYESVLRREGLEPDHDAVYFRFLLKLGGVRANGTLYDRFESLLEDMGIQLEFGDDEGEAEEGSRAISANDSSSEGQRSYPTGTPRDRSRRASFSSFNEPTGDATHVSPRRARSQSPISRPQSPFASRHRRRVSNKISPDATERSEVVDNLRHFAKQGIIRGRVKDHQTGSESHQYMSKRRSASRQSVSPVSHRRKVYGAHRDSSSFSSEDRGDGQLPRDLEPEPEPVAQQSKRRVSQAEPGLPPELIFRPSKDQMAASAQTFYSHRLLGLFRDAFHQWYSHSLQAHPYRQNLDNIATQHDRSILLSQAFDTWRTTYKQKRQQAETRRFYDQLGKRADRARDLYILTKAFTHWAQCASDEVQRTSTARRHILRVKYFHAWKEITAVNEFKIRRFSLERYFTLWRRRQDVIFGNVQAASTIHDSSLVRTSYWTWFWTFCENRAPEWSAGRVKRRYFSIWLEAIAERREREGWIEGVRRRNALRAFLGRWSDHAKYAQARQIETMASRNKQLMERYWFLWRKHASLGPVARHVTDRVDWRVASEAMRNWIIRTRMEKQSNKVNQQRILRNAFTAWNDRLRWQTLVHRIDERVVLQTLYRWLLAERQILLRRHLDGHLKHRVLGAFLTRWTEKRKQLVQCEEMVVLERDKRITKAVLARWNLQLELQKQRSRLASDILIPRLLHGALEIWVYQHRRVRALERNAVDAYYYFGAKDALHKWQQSALASKREKRRNAYAQVRRMLKMNVARRALSTWRSKVAQCGDLMDEAQTVFQSRTLVIGMDYFDCWRARYAECQEFDVQARATRETSLLRQQFNRWKRRIQALGNLDSLSTYHAELHTLNQTATLLRKLGMLAFQHSNRDKSAETLHSRNERKHFRNILRHWRERAGQRRAQQPAPGGSRMEPGRTGGEPVDEAPGGMTALAAEEWTTFDELVDLGDWIPGVEASSSTTPLPGYLSTPSKRAVRAKALVKLSSTTPRTPMIRPFHQRLRSQYSVERGSGAMASGPRDFGTSIFRERPSAAIEPIEEVSSPTPGERKNGDE